jgi:hypothetical protein
VRQGPVRLKPVEQDSGWIADSTFWTIGLTVITTTKEFTVKDLKAGYHAYSVRGMDKSGYVRPSNPVLVVVRSPATSP